MFPLALSIGLCLLLQYVAPSFTPLATTVELGGVSYYVPGKPFSSISSDCYDSLTANGSHEPWLPITIVAVNTTSVDEAGIQTITESFGNEDDVWTSDFLSGVLIIPSVGNVTIESSSNTTTILGIADNSFPDIPQGPYLLSANGGLYQPWRLYADFAGAFTQATVPSLAVEGEYAPLPATVAGSPGVAVPSRLYYTKTAKKPLAGVRAGIKDIFDVAGVKTSGGDRAYYGFYPPRNASALVVQRLVDAGAVIVGKMKTSQFANGEVATADWVDYHSPFNPRGDGYQDPSSSSSGPGAGIGSFPWLDLTVGSDTGGSIRGPSQAQGVFGNRPTHGLVELTNTIPLAPQLDTAGFLIRDPAIWTAAAKVIYADNISFYPAYPSKIQTIAFPTAMTIAADNITAQTNAVLLSFLSKLEGFLQTKSSALNYTAQWDNNKPDASLPSLFDLLNRTYATIVSKEQTRLVRDPFFAAYGAIHDGRTPFIDPAPRISAQLSLIMSIVGNLTVRWAYGDSLPASDLDQGILNKTIFKDWFEANVLPPANASLPSCSESILLYNVSPMPTYRNTYLL